MAGRAAITKDTLDFIDRLSKIPTTAGIIAALQGKLNTYGFSEFIISGLPEPGADADRLILLNGWPDGWFDAYRSKNYIAHDPVAAFCRISTEPFLWRDVAYERERQPLATEVMDRARDFGLVNGLCVPIHGTNGLEAVVSISGRNPDLSPEILPALHLMALHTHARASQLLRAESDEGEHVLSLREREVLSWLAIGKSAEQVGDILSISRTTVTAHYESASLKLGVRGRIRTIVEAYKRGEIVL